MSPGASRWIRGSPCSRRSPPTAWSTGPICAWRWRAASAITTPEVDVALNAAAAANDRSASLGERWVDPVLGLRLRAPVSEARFVDGYADMGGFGIDDASDPSWQVFGGPGYRFLSIEKDIGGGDTRLKLYGPLLGVTARFRGRRRRACVGGSQTAGCDAPPRVSPRRRAPSGRGARAVGHHMVGCARARRAPRPQPEQTG